MHNQTWGLLVDVGLHFFPRADAPMFPYHGKADRDIVVSILCLTKRQPSNLEPLQGWYSSATFQVQRNYLWHARSQVKLSTLSKDLPRLSHFRSLGKPTRELDYREPHQEAMLYNMDAASWFPAHICRNEICATTASKMLRELDRVHAGNSCSQSTPTSTSLLSDEPLELEDPTRTLFVRWPKASPQEHCQYGHTLLPINAKVLRSAPILATVICRTSWKWAVVLLAR
ncbi:hypothetical protein J1614_006094 [Plenodomus biglobosus]|nr:hypothetical protein J1614_006094 [Plenodomus biglobosus]